MCRCRFACGWYVGVGRGGGALTASKGCVGTSFFLPCPCILGVLRGPVLCGVEVWAGVAQNFSPSPAAHIWSCCGTCLGPFHAPFRMDHSANKSPGSSCGTRPPPRSHSHHLLLQRNIATCRPSLRSQSTHSAPTYQQQLSTNVLSSFSSCFCSPDGLFPSRKKQPQDVFRSQGQRCHEDYY